MSSSSSSSSSSDADALLQAYCLSASATAVTRDVAPVSAAPSFRGNEGGGGLGSSCLVRKFAFETSFFLSKCGHLPLSFSSSEGGGIPVLCGICFFVRDLLFFLPLSFQMRTSHTSGCVGVVCVWVSASLNDQWGREAASAAVAPLVVDVEACLVAWLNAHAAARWAAQQRPGIKTAGMLSSIVLREVCGGSPSSS